MKSGLLQNVFGNQLRDSQCKTQYNLISVRSSQAACSHHEEACPKGTNSLLNCFGLYSIACLILLGGTKWWLALSCKASQLLPCKASSCCCCGDVNTPMGMIPVETRSQREKKKKIATKAETPTFGAPFPGLCASQVQEVCQELHEATPPVAFAINPNTI